MRKLPVLTMALLCLTLFAVPALAEITNSTADATWTQVKDYTDGTLIPFEVDVGYIIRWGTSPGNYTELHDAGWYVLNWRLSGLVPGTTYYVSVRSYTSRDEEGAFSPDYVYYHAGVAPRMPVYRFMNKKNWTYLYTTDENEKNYYVTSQSRTWQFEGIKFYVYAIQQSGTVPVYRFLNKKNWTYLFTTDEAEKNYYISYQSGTWQFEGIKFYVFQTQQTGTIPVYRFLNKKNWSYLYTVNENEKDYYISSQSGTWTYEGIRFYVYAFQQ